MPYGKDGKVTPQMLSDMLASVKDRANFDDIQIMTLRSMNQAIYSIDNDGHFGLAYTEYTHFTSPIRRYPDLVVHRLIKSIIGEYKYGGSDYQNSDLANICDSASHQERNADGASKQVESWLKCYYMKNYIGQTLNARVAHINGLGIFAELKDMYVEGLIHVSAIKGDYYVFDEANNVLVGRRTRKTYKINQEISVRVVRADLDNIHIDFEIVGADTGSNADVPKSEVIDGELSDKPKKKKFKKKPFRKKKKKVAPEV
jgi:ribonuclease R